MHEIRGSDVFLKEDIRAQLEGLLVANELMARQMAGSSMEYRRGFAAAILAVSLSFDIQLETHMSAQATEIRRLIDGP